MHISIERGALMKALDRVRNVVEGRNTIPILSNVLLTISGSVLKLTTTDLDMEATAVATTNDFDSSDGSIAVPASTFYEVIRKMADGSNILLRYDGDDPRLLIKAGRSKFNLPVLPADQFPSMSGDGLSDPVTIASGALIGLWDSSSFCMSTEETRYYLNGIYLHMVDGKLRSVATDGHRLGLAEMDAPERLDIPGVIIPRKTVRESRRMMDAAQLINIEVSPTKVRFSTADGAVLTSKVVDGAFPDYMRVIPKGNDKIVRIDPGLLAAGVDRVATISSEKARSVKLTFRTGDPGTVTLTVRNMEAGQGVEEIELNDSGLDDEIGLNARYVLDVLQRFKGTQAIIRLDDPSSPTLWLDENDPGVQYVIMPLRV